MRSSFLSGKTAALHDFKIGSRELFWTHPMMIGEDVQFVQLRVGAAPDGKFGEKTHNAVIKFQHAKGINPTGVVDDETLAALKKVSAPGSGTPGGDPIVKDQGNNRWILWTLGGLAAAGLGTILAKQ